MENDSILILIILSVVGISLYLYLKDINNIKVSSTAQELRELANETYSNLKGNKFVLSAGELNYKAYESFSATIEKVLTNNNDSKFVIYCGPYFLFLFLQ